ncbi:MAG: hypothetical protein A3B31_03665 [Candidatus Komeilibacteria bacterium RIFCSPLOWO2_01_FULL_53_11]|uniref:Uncharacterized protein n=1 Tax=Candidatus Komeilibacteria bacterium RIFCSPLOWO2_01_FULL_53_11 TaxID=1798552 RepID=A0A1G2BNN5_9BACT|nr:MAG: hypothetical protein A3B31_03665 [Candidatus Komeilibacteria bacterium RIFCSPLOWO2_01_FULL_53_11]
MIRSPRIIRKLPPILLLLAVLVSGRSNLPYIWRAFLVPEAHAAFSAVTARGSATLSGTGSSLAVSPDSNLTVGKIVIAAVVSDNEDTADGATTLHTVSDTHGHTWTKVFEETETDGAADDGSTTSLWWTKVQTAITTSDSITLALGTSKSDALIALVEVSIAAGATVAAVSPSPTHSASGTSLSDSLSSLTSRQYLFFGLFGAEGEDTAKTPIANYTERHDLVSTTAGQAPTNVQMHVGTRILTGTGDTWTSSAVSFTNGTQSLAAFYEITSSAPTITVDEPDGTSDSVMIGTSYDIQYDLADSDDVVSAAFYYDSDASGLNGTALTGACATAAEGTNVTCSWDTTSMSAGNYYIYGIVTDGTTQTSDYSPGQITLSAGSLSVDIVDSGGSPVGSPSVAMSTQAFSFALTVSTGTLGSSNEKIRVTNTSATASWSLTIGATSGSTAVWTTGSVTYDFNDPTASAGDGGDADSVGGQLTINPAAGTITPQSGCSTTGVSLGSSNAFSEGVTNSITLATANGSAQTGCYWDFTGIGLSQDIPAAQSVGTYTINFTLTAS